MGRNTLLSGRRTPSSGPGPPSAGKRLVSSALKYRQSKRSARTSRGAAQRASAAITPATADFFAVSNRSMGTPDSRAWTESLQVARQAPTDPTLPAKAPGAGVESVQLPVHE